MTGSAWPLPIAVSSVGVVLLAAHVISWQRARTNADAVDSPRPAWQFRRRVAASSLVALLGPLMLLALQTNPAVEPLRYLFLWCCVSAGVVALLALAAADVMASRRSLRALGAQRRAARERLVGEAHKLRLAAEARRAQTAEGNEGVEPHTD